MPVETREPAALYIAKSMHQLNEKVDLKMDKGSSVKAYCNTAAKMYKAAQEAKLKKDEERAYVLYMKFCNLAQQIRKTKGYASDKEYYNSMMGANNILSSVEKAEQLAKSLDKRYTDLKEAEEIKARLDQRDREEEKAKNQPKDPNGTLSNGVNGTSGHHTNIGTDGSITSEELYRLFQDSSKAVLVLDARSPEQFEASHIICDKCASIPDSAIKPGCTVAVIEKGLSPADSALFKQRGKVDYIVMLDWESSINDLTPHSTLSSLKDAIYKWDSTMTLKHEPLVLDGGYDRWILKYPMYSTDPKVPKPPSNDQSIKKYSSLDFDYPTSLEEDEPEKPPEPKPAAPSQAPVDSPANLTRQNGSVVKPTSIGGGGGGMAIATSKPTPTINRSLKPGAAGVPQAPVSASTMPAARGGIPTSTPSATDGPSVSTSRSRGPIPTGTGDAQPTPAAPKQTTPVPGRLPQIRKDAQEEDLPPPTYDDVKENAEEEVAQQNLLQEHKDRENQARIELERMRQNKVKAENEQLRRDKVDMEKQLEEKIAALQTLQKQLQEQQVKQEEERKLAEEAAKAEEAEKKVSQGDNTGDAGMVSASTAGPVSSKTPASAQPGASPATTGAGKPSPTKGTTPSPSPSPATTKPQQKTQPASPQPMQPAATVQPPGVKMLPTGWEKKLDKKSGRYFYVDHNTGTTHWTPPALVSAGGSGVGGGGQKVKPAAVPKAAQGSPKVSPQHVAPKVDPPSAHVPSKASTSADSINTNKARLKSSSDADFNSKPSGGGLKRSFSSPNIAKMVMEEETRPSPVTQAPIPAFDRSNKPSERYIQQQVRPVTVSRMRNLQPVYGSMGQGRTGLKNIGNTCFMSSVVQCLSATTLLSHYFISDKYLPHINRANPLGRKGEVVEEFAVVIKALWSGQYRSISPRDLRDTVCKYVPEFSKHMGHHHDSQEFLLFLMDGLHEDVNQVTKRVYVEEPDYAKMPDEEASRIAWDNHKRFNRSIIVELFQGQYKSTIQCMTCNHESVKFDAFTFLTLPIPSSGRVPLKKCLEDFSKAEKMTGDNAYHCSRCKRKRNSIKTILLWKLPPVLLICLKRFYHEGMWRQKLQTMVEYPLQDVDMGPFTKGPRVRGSYNLFAVSNHSGTLDGGHYTAYCKNAINKRWYKYDDHEVYDVSTGNIKSSAAYILFYSSIDLPPP